MQQSNMDEVDSYKQQEDELYSQFLACPIVELTGVVSPSGVSASKSRGQELWSLILSFDAWRIGDGTIRNEYLTIRKRVAEEQLRQFQSEIDAETVVKIFARVAENNVFGIVQAQIEGFSGLVPDDAELNTRLAELQKPKTFNDTHFGTFTFDRRVEWYLASVKWLGETIDLTLNGEEPDEIESCLKVARELWANESSWQTRMQNYAVEELLPLKNDSWLDDNELDLTPDTFKRKMTLQSISIYPDGDFEFWHDDGDMFFGHSIQLCGNLTDGLTSADIPG